MFTELQNIWQPHGVVVRPRQADNCDRLLLVKPDAEARPEDMAPDSALGWVPFVAGKAKAAMSEAVEFAVARVY